MADNEPVHLQIVIIAMVIPFIINAQMEEKANLVISYQEISKRELEPKYFGLKNRFKNQYCLSWY